jgi:hypothetical protein
VLGRKSAPVAVCLAVKTSAGNPDQKRKDNRINHLALTAKHMAPSFFIFNHLENIYGQAHAIYGQAHSLSAKEKSQVFEKKGVIPVQSRPRPSMVMVIYY